MKKVPGFWAPTGDIRGVPVQGPLPNSEQRGPVRLPHERAAAHKTVEAPKHVRQNFDCKEDLINVRVIQRYVPDVGNHTYRPGEVMSSTGQ